MLNKEKVKVKSFSPVRLFVTPWTSSPGQNTGAGSFFPSPVDLPSKKLKVSCIAGRFFTNWAIREVPFKWMHIHVHWSSGMNLVRKLRGAEWKTMTHFSLHLLLFDSSPFFSCFPHRNLAFDQVVYHNCTIKLSMNIF